MGNYRFKLSDMIPNAWFYKLKDMGRARKQNQTQSKKKKQPSQASTTQSSSKPKQPLLYNPRKSYYFTRELHPNDKIYISPQNNRNVIKLPNSPEPPRKSSKHRLKRRTTTTRTLSSSSSSPPKLVVTENSSSPPPAPHDHSSAETEFPDPEFRTDRVLPTESFGEEKTVPWTTNDIIIDVDNNSIARKDDKLQHQQGCDNDYEYDCEYDSFSDLVLPPIVTKPSNLNDMLSDAKKKQTKQRSKLPPNEEQGSLKVKILKEETATEKEPRSNNGRRVSASSPRVRLRMNSPRLASRRIQSHGRRSVSSTGGGRRSLSDSFAIVKSSLNPQRDFRESMVEMIVQNNIRTSKDLEDLLACYLSLNSDEYHELIIKVFKQIWFDLTDN